MAIEFARSHVLSRSSGHTAVKAAAYRAGERLNDERTGLVADYSHRSADVGHSEILLPVGADPRLLDRETLWAAVETREDQHNRRASAQLAIDHIVALPAELSRKQHLLLAKAFAQQEFVARGLVVDLAIHYHSDGNPHAHLMTTTRKLQGAVFGAKDREGAGKFYAGSKIADDVQLRHRWADFQNDYFQAHNIDLMVLNHAGEYQSEKHLGAAHQMDKRGVDTELNDTVHRIRSNRELAVLNSPSIVIDRVANKKAVFTRHDLYREANKLIKNDAVFAELKVKLDVEPSLVRMRDSQDHERLTTIGTLKTEHALRLVSDKLKASDGRFAISESLKTHVMENYEFLSSEQRRAVAHLTEPNRLGIVIGLAGAGKSTMLEAVKHINTAVGNRVFGVALAGKAADELEKSSGISASTITSFLNGVKAGRVDIAAGDVLVVDEFGMVSTQQAEQLLSVAEEVGAKLIAVGDTEQLQSIQAGAALRDLSERHGFAGIETIRRQRQPWQAEATLDLAKGRTLAAIDAYAERGHVRAVAKGQGAVVVINDYLADNTPGSKAVLAHRRKDVAELNAGIRQGLVEAGKLDSGKAFDSKTGRDEQQLMFDLEVGDEVVFHSADSVLGLAENDGGTFTGLEDGHLSFVHNDGRVLTFSPERYHDIDIPGKQEIRKTLTLSQGERILFTRNDSKVGVKNGQFGDLLSYEVGTLTVRLESGQVVEFNQQDYSDITYGYATTIHKAQGTTVDTVYLLGSTTMDRHLAYVGMSRHREGLKIYSDDEAQWRQSVSRNNSQKTALNFSEQHDLVLSSPEHSETIDQILQGEALEDMAIPHTIQPISPEAYQRAVRRLEQEETKIVAALTAAAERPVIALKKEARLLSETIETIRLEKPKARLFKTQAFEKKLVSWQHRMDVKTAEYQGLIRLIDSNQSGRVFSESQEKLQQEAKRLAHRARPNEVAIMKGFTADLRIAELTAKLQTLEKDIIKARTASDEKKLTQLLTNKSNVLNSLQKSNSLLARQNRTQRQQISKAVLGTNKELGVRRSRGIGLGR